MTAISFATTTAAFAPNLSDCTLLFQGAEARVYAGVYSATGQDAIAKYRFPKGYKHPQLDKQTRERRARAEMRALEAATAAGLRVPKPIYLDEANTCLYMSRIRDSTLAELMRHDSGLLEDNGLAALVGNELAKMHAVPIIHSDLTTSNMLYNPDRHEISIIDFGLATRAPVTPETMAVDLYVLQRSVLALHGPNAFFGNVLEAYVCTMDQCTGDKRLGQKIKTQFEQVQSRGRKRELA